MNANYAIIQGGINDIVQGRTLSDIQADIQWMHDQAIIDGMQPIICTCTPTVSIQAWQFLWNIAPTEYMDKTKFRAYS